MEFDFNTLEPLVFKVLSAPNVDLSTISAKGVRHELPDVDPSLTPRFLKVHKEKVDVVIARVYEQVSAWKVEGNGGVEGIEVTPSGSRKRRLEGPPPDHEIDGDEPEEEESKISYKKTKMKGETRLSDAEYARKLNNEINSRSRRSTTKGRGNTNGSVGKRGSKLKKSSATVESDEGSVDERGRKNPKLSTRGGSAKGGFAKAYVLSEPLAAVLEETQLSRPQVVKHLWDYIKKRGLQNPSNKREILCDEDLKAVFGTEKIDMFKMNRVLTQHLHESES